MRAQTFHVKSLTRPRVDPFTIDKRLVVEKRGIVQLAKSQIGHGGLRKFEERNHPTVKGKLVACSVNT
jgi:hypothetical protein